MGRSECTAKNTPCGTFSRSLTPLSHHSRVVPPVNGTERGSTVACCMEPREPDDSCASKRDLVSSRSVSDAFLADLGTASPFAGPSTAIDELKAALGCLSRAHSVVLYQDNQSYAVMCAHHHHPFLIVFFYLSTYRLILPSKYFFTELGGVEKHRGIKVRGAKRGAAADKKW